MKCMVSTFISHGWVIAWLTSESGVSCPSPWPPLFRGHLPLVPRAFFSHLSTPAHATLYWVPLVVLLILLIHPLNRTLIWIDVSTCGGGQKGYPIPPLHLDTQYNHSVQFTCSVMSESLQPHGLQHTRPPCPSPTPGVYSNSCPWVGNAIQLSHTLSSPSPPAFNLSQHQSLFKWVSSSHQVAKRLEFQLQHWSFQWIFRTDFLQDGLVGSPFSPRNSQESSPTPQFKSINSLALSFLYGSPLTSIHDHWKNHSLD